MGKEKATGQADTKHHDTIKDKEKEEKGMNAAINKPSGAMMIRSGMTREFIEALKSVKKGKSYWDECHASKKPISSSDMDKLRKMYNGED